LNFEGSGEQYDEMVSMVGGMMGDDMGAMMEELLAMMTVNQLSYEIHVDKVSFYQTKVFVTMDMEMEMEGEKMMMVQSVDSSLSNFDGIEEITVPQEVIDKAEEISMEELEKIEGEEGL
jgi:transcription-repair coupling factor (superfamily II helicase)